MLGLAGLGQNILSRLSMTPVVIGHKLTWVIGSCWIVLLVRVEVDLHRPTRHQKTAITLSQLVQCNRPVN